RQQTLVLLAHLRAYHLLNPGPRAPDADLRAKRTPFSPSPQGVGKNGVSLLLGAYAPAGSLQICLEVAVVADFLVNLQPVSLTVSDDHRVAVRVELDLGREAEAPLWLEALHPTACLHHVGIGVDALLAPFGQDVRIADQCGDRAAVGVEDADPVVAPVAHIDVAVTVDRNIGRVIELVGPGMPGLFAVAGDVGPEDRHGKRPFRLFALAEAPDARQEFALGRQFLHPVVVPVGDPDVAVLVEGDAPGLVELAWALAGAAAFGDKLAVRAEHLQTIVATVGDDHIAVFFDREASGTQQFAITAAGFT